MTIVLMTDRLELRPLAPADYEEHALMMQDPRVARFLSLDQRPQSRQTSWRGFASMLGHWQMRGFGFFSAFARDSGRWVGRVGPWMPEGWPGLECGWGVAPQFWGRGYAPEAAVATIRWIFEQRPELDRIISLIDPKNANSQQVAKKIGEAKTGETYRLDDLKLDIWAAHRSLFELKSA